MLSDSVLVHVVVHSHTVKSRRLSSPGNALSCGRAASLTMHRLPGVEPARLHPGASRVFFIGFCSFVRLISLILIYMTSSCSRGGNVDGRRTALQGRSSNLRAVVEVVPVVAGAHPVVVGSGVVGLVIGVGGRVVQLAGLRVLAGSLGVEGGSSLTVKGREHLHRTRQECKQEEARVGGRQG